MASKMVLILVNHDFTIYNFRLELVERLLDAGYDVYLSSPYGESIDALVEMGCHYIETDVNRHGKNPWEEWELFRHYKKMMKQLSPDIVLTYTIKPNIYGGLAAKTFNIPCIANITGLGSAFEKDGVMQKVFLLLYKLAFQDVSQVFFQNARDQQFFADHKIAADKRDIIPGSGVNLRHFTLLDYPGDSPVEFIFIARVMQAKGIEQFLEAAVFIKAKYPFTRFHVLGFCEEDYESRLNQLQEQGVIYYHGKQQDIRPFLAKAHCTIHPTYYPEGMSNVLLESAASGRPVIATNRSGCQEIIDAGVNGYVVEERNSQDLIDKIEQFLSLSHSERMQMGIAGRRKVENEFDREVVVDAYMNGIQKALG